MTVPQLRAMHAGDRARKSRLVSHGYRLPSALDHRYLFFSPTAPMSPICRTPLFPYVTFYSCFFARPLTSTEFWERVPQAVFVSATPGAELKLCSARARNTISELVVRPTGIPDPQVHVVNALEQQGYEDHLLAQVEARMARGERCLVTALTKRFAEELADFFVARGVPSVYVHSGLKPAARLQAVEDLRAGRCHVLVGCNMLREGLDLPEVSLVAITGAEKQGFLRSETSLIQTIGRAARHTRGTVLLYTEQAAHKSHHSHTPRVFLLPRPVFPVHHSHSTFCHLIEQGDVSPAMDGAIRETTRRRNRQLRHNEANGIVPFQPGRRATHSARNAVLDALLEGQPARPKAVRAARGGTSQKVAAEAAEAAQVRALDPPSREFFETLQKWREEQAEATGVKAAKILPSGVLVRIAAARPTSIEQLRAVKGMGAVRSQRHGGAIVRLAALPPAAQSEEARRDDGDTAAGHIGEATFTPERGSMYPTAPVEAAFGLSATGV